MRRTECSPRAPDPGGGRCSDGDMERTGNDEKNRPYAPPFPPSSPLLRLCTGRHKPIMPRIAYVRTRPQPGNEGFCLSVCLASSSEHCRTPRLRPAPCVCETATVPTPSSARIHPISRSVPTYLPTYLLAEQSTCIARCACGGIAVFARCHAASWPGDGVGCDGRWR